MTNIKANMLNVGFLISFTMNYSPDINDVNKAVEHLKGIANITPLQLLKTASEEHQANIYIKREDQQAVRSYKLRGAYNKMSSLNSEELSNGIVCASAGNHAQGVAYSCKKLKVKGTIFMPLPTPNQKLEQVKKIGGEFVEVILTGDTFDQAKNQALDFSNVHQATFIPPFDDKKVIEGQGTVAIEILDQIKDQIDFLFLPVGGGGLASGVSSVFKTLSPSTKIIGVEPQGAPSLSKSLELGDNITLDQIDTFIDGAAVQQIGHLNFPILKNNLDDVVLVPEGQVCQTMLKLYNQDAIVAEPAGALTLSALEQYQNKIIGKNVVCVLSGGNNDITRTEEIREKALLHAGLKHYFIVNFPQRSGALKEFVQHVLGENDDITHFEYTKKVSREKGSAVVGIELKNKEDFNPLLTRMKDRGFYKSYINNESYMLDLLV